MDYYADTGFLISLYINEATTATASLAVQNVTEPLPLISLGFLELCNSLQTPLHRNVSLANLVSPRQSLIP